MEPAGRRMADAPQIENLDHVNARGERDTGFLARLLALLWLCQARGDRSAQQTFGGLNVPILASWLCASPVDCENEKCQC